MLFMKARGSILDDVIRRNADDVTVRIEILFFGLHVLLRKRQECVLKLKADILNVSYKNVSHIM